MPTRPTVLLTSGGMRSLVAMAVTLSAPERPPLILVHLRDNRPTGAIRREHVIRQAAHYHVTQVIDVEMPNLATQDAPRQREGTQASRLVRPQVLVMAVAQAVELDAERIIWPCQVNGDYATVARVTEQIVLLQHMIQLEHPDPPPIETPLLEHTDVQVVELGGSLGAPWQLAWSCMIPGEVPCRMCPVCRRRHAAFEAAGVIDPVEKLTTAAARR
ncbi:MAG: 7-cyano-7-deazaguanine synthase [Planctomycetes bacterium]|nr:7-cyano-7-deazaguanine synthase [Planctomycetota bacterium]